ncbi:MAG TPA: tRNA pseudouridine(38-40) synthase TruA [Ignavibacteriaceae bacterium]|nr:tRNA pseudouridine(38-40) synthase TruA [Ignavibacteriaceae bacterium]
MNYKLTIQYDGTNYAGWQIQAGDKTVQQTITECIATLTGKQINLIGSGRTDSGVHALGQEANFRIDEELDLYKFKYSLNSVLPKDISIINSAEVPEEFHARYDARKRKYLYLFVNYKSPFYEKYSYRYFYKLDCNFLNKISKSFIGEKDFTSFSRKASETEEKECIVYDIGWKETKGFVFFFIEANRFLHGMVRTIIGTLLNAQKNNYDEKYIEDIFSAKNRETASESVPSRGLFLYKVKY